MIARKKSEAYKKCEQIVRLLSRLGRVDLDQDIVIDGFARVVSYNPFYIPDIRLSGPLVASSDPVNHYYHFEREDGSKLEAISEAKEVLKIVGGNVTPYVLIKCTNFREVRIRPMKRD
jgi:hypothetical protein